MQVPGKIATAQPNGNRRVCMATITREQHWTKRQIAALSFSQVARLNYDEMVQVVLDAGVSVRDVERVHSMDGDLLMRHVHWAIECCRHEPTS